MGREASRLYHEGRASEARALLEAHLSEHPDDVDAHIAYCELRSVLGERESVRQEYEKLAEENPSNHALELASIKLQRLSGERTERFREFLEKNPGYARGWEEFGKGELEALREDLAIEALEKAVSLDPDRARAYLYLGLAHRLAEDPAEEMAAMRKAADLDPESTHIRLELAKTLFYQGKAREAEQFLGGLEEELKGDAEYYAIRASVLARLDRAEKAEALRKAAVEAAPVISENLTFWANRLRLSGHNEQAEREFHLAIFLDSSYVEAYMQLAVHEHALGRLDDAIRTYKTALRHGPRQGEPNLLAWRNLSVLHEKKGDLAEAERYVREAIKIDPDYLIGWVDLSRILTNQDRTEEALKGWRRVIRMSPYGLEAREARRNIHYLEKGERVPTLEEEYEKQKRATPGRPETEAPSGE